MEPWLDDGWCRLDDLVGSDERAAILADCERLAELAPEQRRAGDKPHTGTRHLVELDERIPLVAEVVTRPVLTDAIGRVLGPNARRCETSLRSPNPGFGGQRLHADSLPMLEPAPATVATAIIALVDVTEANGATVVVPGSHRRPDLQRHSGSLDSHDDEVVLAGPAGTAFVFTGHLLHAGRANRSDSARPVLHVVWRVD